MISPFYRSGLIYRAGMNLMHGGGLGQKYEFITKFISPSDRVLDVGCGTGTLQSHLNGNYYLGLEMNDNFIRYAKGKGRNVMKQDALEFNKFGEFDVCVMMDLLHHLNPHHEELIRKALAGVKKTVIISEPFDVPGRNPLIKKLIRFIDSDGINSPAEWMDQETLIKFYGKFKPTKVERVGQSVIAVYQR